MSRVRTSGARRASFAVAVALALALAASVSACQASKGAVLGPRRALVATVPVSSVELPDAPTIATAPFAAATKVKRATLSNGMSICIAEKHDTPTFTLDVTTPTPSGVPVPLALFWRGSLLVHGYDGGVFSNGLRALGELGVTASTEGIGESASERMSGLAVNLPKTIDVAGKMMVDVAYSERSLTIARASLKSIASRAGDAGTRTWFEVAHDETLTGDSWLTSWTAARVGMLDTFTAVDVARVHATAFSPANVTLVLAGDVKSERAIARFEDEFGRWDDASFHIPTSAPAPTPSAPDPRAPKAPTPKPPKPLDASRDARRDAPHDRGWFERIVDRPAAVSAAATPTVTPAPIVLIDRPAGAQTTIGVFSPALAFVRADIASADLLSTVLQRRLMEDLRDARSLTYGAFAGVSVRKEARPFVAFADVDTPRALEAIKALFDQLRRIVVEPIDPHTLTHAATRLIEARQTMWLTNTGLVEWLHDRMLEGDACDAPDDYAERLTAVTPIGLQKFAAARLKLGEGVGAMRILVVGDATTLKPQLEGLGMGRVEVRKR